MYYKFPCQLNLLPPFQDKETNWGANQRDSKKLEISCFFVWAGFGESKIDGSSAIVKSPDSYFFIQKTFVIDEVGKQLESIMSQKS